MAEYDWDKLEGFLRGIDIERGVIDNLELEMVEKTGRGNIGLLQEPFIIFGFLILLFFTENYIRQPIFAIFPILFIYWIECDYKIHISW